MQSMQSMRALGHPTHLRPRVMGTRKRKLATLCPIGDMAHAIERAILARDPHVRQRTCAVMRLETATRAACGKMSHQRRCWGKLRARAWYSAWAVKMSQRALATSTKDVKT